MYVQARHTLRKRYIMAAKILSTPHTKWIVVKSHQDDSKITEGQFYTVTMMNELGEIAVTYVDDSNRNQRMWMDIVELYNQGLSSIVSGLRYKKDRNGDVKLTSRTKEPIVNADSKPTLHGTMETHEAIAALIEMLGEPLDKLFEYGMA